ncbi:uncharacterized protein PG986_008508 [Apiospora aurea]|uniref:Secreted protein n=1 Tax=Apiospora aurea TaxID=335848 RepID=A0ABR1QFL3_9PEZI
MGSLELSWSTTRKFLSATVALLQILPLFLIEYRPVQASAHRRARILHGTIASAPDDDRKDLCGTVEEASDAPSVLLLPLLLQPDSRRVATKTGKGTTHSGQQA